MKKVYVYMMLFVFVTFSYALFASVPSFVGVSNPLNLSFNVSGETNTYDFEVPLYGHVDNITLVVNYIKPALGSFLYDRDLIAYWQIDDLSGNITDNKIYGNQSNLSYSKAAYHYSKDFLSPNSTFSILLNHSDAEDYFNDTNHTLNNTLNSMGNFTASCWIGNRSTTNAETIMSFYDNNPATIGGWRIYFSGNPDTYRFSFIRSDTEAQFTCSALTASDWTNSMFTVTFNDNETTLYVNTTKVNQECNRNNLGGNPLVIKNNTEVNFMIGATRDFSLGQYDTIWYLGDNLNAPTHTGTYIDECFIINRSLKPKDIENLYYNGINLTSEFTVSYLNITTSLNDSIDGDYMNFSLDITRFNDSMNNDCKRGTQDGLNCIFPFTFTSSVIGNYLVNLTNASYEFGIDNCTDYGYPVLNTTYRDERSRLPLSVSNGWTLNTLTPFLQNLTGQFNGNTNNKWCSMFNPLNRTINYTLSGEFNLERTEYASRFYSFPSGFPIIASNNPANTINLSIIRLNESSTVVFQWLTETFEAITGTMLVYRCYTPSERLLVDSVPIINGRATTNIELVNALYSYEVVIGDTVYSDFDDYSKCHIESETSRQYFVDTGEDITAPLGLYSVPCNISREGNNTVAMKWGSNPEDPSTIQGCLQAFRHSPAGTVKVYEFCTTTENSINRTIPVSGFDYTVTGKLFQGGYSKVCDGIVEFMSDTSAARLFSLSGLMSVFFLIVGIVLLFSENAKAQQIGAIVALLLSFILGLLAIGWQTISALIAFLIMIMIIGRRSKKE